MAEQQTQALPLGSLGNYEVVRDFLTAYSEYLRALCGSHVAEEVRKQLKEAQDTFAQSVREALASGDYQKLQAVYITYWKKGQDLGPREEWDRAYQSFLRASQDAWSKLDLDKIVPAHLLAIGNTFIAAAQLSSSTYRQRI